MIYVLELSCEEDGCNGPHECNQIYYLYTQARCLTTDKKEDHWVKLAEIISTSAGREMLIEGKDGDGDQWGVKAKLCKFEGCYDSFKQGFDLYDDIMNTEHATKRFILLPEDFKPLECVGDDELVFNGPGEFWEYVDKIKSKKPRIESSLE